MRMHAWILTLLDTFRKTNNSIFNTSRIVAAMKSDMSGCVTPCSTLSSRLFSGSLREFNIFSPHLVETWSHLGLTRRLLALLALRRSFGFRGPVGLDLSFTYLISLRTLRLELVEERAFHAHGYHARVWSVKTQWILSSYTRPIP
jgi:hypothetical protein